MIGVTGSTGKTSTKDLLLAVLAPHRRTVASRANFNTEIGLPLEILAAPAGTEVLVLEMGMRGPDQITELARDKGAEHPDLRAVIKADAAVTHGRVIHVLDLLKQASVNKIAFGVTPVAALPLPAPAASH